LQTGPLGSALRRRLRHGVVHPAAGTGEQQPRQRQLHDDREQQSNDQRHEEGQHGGQHHDQADPEGGVDRQVANKMAPTAGGRGGFANRGPGGRRFPECGSGGLGRVARGGALAAAWVSGHGRVRDGTLRVGMWRRAGDVHASG